MSVVKFLATPVPAFIMTDVAAGISLGVKKIPFHFFVGDAAFQAVGLGLMPTMEVGEKGEIPDRL